MLVLIAGASHTGKTVLLKNVLQENAQVLDSAQKYKVNDVLIEDAYDMEINL